MNLAAIDIVTNTKGLILLHPFVTIIIKGDASRKNRQ